MQNYAHQVFGLTKMTRTKATEAAKSLLGQAGLNDVAAHTGERVTKLAEDLLTASRANRNVLEKLVPAEVDKAATRLGLCGCMTWRSSSRGRRPAQQAQRQCRSRRAARAGLSGQRPATLYRSSEKGGGQEIGCEEGRGQEGSA